MIETRRLIDCKAQRKQERPILYLLQSLTTIKHIVILLNSFTFHIDENEEQGIITTT